MSSLPTFKRGQLIRFDCIFDGKSRCSWSGIYHGDGRYHGLGRRSGGTLILGKPHSSDKLLTIRHGTLIQRNLDIA